MTDLPNLARGIYFGDLCLTDYPFLAEYGMSYTAGDLVTSVLSSFLQDGDLEVSQRRGNMSLTIPVLIEGADLLELAQTEAALAIEAQKPTNTLRIVPGDGFGPPTVFDTFTADLSFQFDDAFERNAMRRFSLSVSALPFGRSEQSVVTPAVNLPSAPVSTVIANGSTTTGWSSVPGATVTSSGGAVHAVSDLKGPAQLTLTQSVDVSSKRWVMCKWTNAKSIQMRLDATSATNSITNLEPYRMDYGQAGGYRLWSWLLPDGFTGPVASLTFKSPPSAVESGPFELVIDEVSVATGPPTLGSGRQQVRQFEVAGSARTQGAVQVASTTTGLGDVLVYTAPPSTLSPPMRDYSTVQQVPDAARVSGSYSTLGNGGAKFDVPVSRLSPGLYGLFALASSPDGDIRPIQWTTTTVQGGVQVGRAAGGVGLCTSATYKFVPLGTVNLPTTGTRANSTAVQRFTIADVTSGTSIRLDDLYLCNLTTGRLTMVSCGTNRRLWLDSATAATRTPSVMVGNAADGSDAAFAGDNIIARNDHEFAPPLTEVTVLATNATDAAVSLNHDPRWLGHAAS